MNNKIMSSDELLVKESKYFRIEQDNEVPIPGFFVIVAKRKVRSVVEFDEKESRDFMDILIKLRKGLANVLAIKDVYLFQNEDTKHNFHLWVFPRYEWMDKIGRKIESVRPIMNYAKENLFNEEGLNKVRAAINNMRDYYNN